MDVSITSCLLLIITGIVAGIINTLAGGGSNLTLPALMLMGLPAEIANATNRVSVVLQTLTATVGFKHHGMLAADDIGPILVPTLIGGGLGACVAVYAPSQLLKPLLLGSMCVMTLIILFKPAVICPEVGTVPFKVRERPLSWFWLGLAGFYGGFVQAGVGFILIATLGGVLRYDLVRTNALKVVCTLAFTLLALVVFIYQGLVWWVPGLILASGTMLGAHIAVKFAITAKAETLKWFLLIMTLTGTAAALIF